MGNRSYAILGLAAPAVLFVTIAACILASPWFRWEANALSDFGHATKSSVAPVFNLGMMLTGLIMLLYALLSMRGHAKKAAYSLMFSGFALQLIGTFNETFGRLHWYVSVIFFLAVMVTTIVYGIEKKSVLALMGLIAVVPWILYYSGMIQVGVAVPETLTALAVTPWIVSSAVKINRHNE